METNNANVIKQKSCHEKIIKVLKKMDELLYTHGCFGDQEIFHQIYKTIMAMERKIRLISRFSSTINDDKKVIHEENDGSTYKKPNRTIFIDGECIEIMNANKSTKIELDDILSYIESQLTIQTSTTSTNEDITYTSSSEEENERDYGREFFSIQIKLKEYLKKDGLCKENFTNMDNIQNNDTRTPMIKMNRLNNVLPVIRRNFFKDMYSDILCESFKNQKSSSRELDIAKKNELNNILPIERNFFADMSVDRFCESFKTQKGSSNEFNIASKLNNILPIERNFFEDSEY